MQGYVTEIMLTLEAAVDNVDVLIFNYMYICVTMVTGRRHAGLRHRDNADVRSGC